MQPVGNRILLKKLQKKETTKNGLYLPDSSQDKQDVYEVVALGTSNHNRKGDPEDFPVSIGDHILVDAFGGQKVTIEDEGFVVIKTEMIIGVLPK